MEDIKVIVDGLNKDPFRQKLTLVSFSQKSPLELLQCVNDVFAVLDAKQKRDLRDEANDQTAVRMLEFLAVLNYKIEADLAQFKDQFMKGSTAVVYPLLRWILERVADLRKRAYLDRYLRPVNVPEEFFADPGVVAQFQKQKELQNEFKDMHKLVDKIRGNSVNPSDLEAENKQLESEKEQLTARLAKLRERVTKGVEFQNVDFEAVLQKTNALRREQEEEAKLQQLAREQKQALIRADQELKQGQARLKELEGSDFARQDPMTVLNRLREQVKQQRQLNDEKLEKEIRERERQLRDLEHELTNEQFTEDHVHELEAEAGHLQREIEDLINKRDSMNASDGQIGFIRDRAAQVEKAKEKKMAQMAELEEERKDAEDELKRLDGDLKHILGSSEKPKTDAQMKQYTKDIQAKTAVYKTHKSDLQFQKDEVAVLQKTEEVLRARCPNIEELEKERGMLQELDDVSKATSDLNTNKAQTLDEISQLVKQVTNNLKAKKNKIAPLIKELRGTRTQYENMLKGYTEKKKAYDALVAGLSSERTRLEEDVKENLQGIQQDESQYHFLTCLGHIYSARLEQVTQEQKLVGGYGEVRLEGDAKSYSELYDRSIREHEAAAKRLREEKKTIKDTHEENVGQRQMYLHLRKLLSCKLRQSKEQKETDRKRENAAASGGGQSENFMKISDSELAGVDHLTMGD